MNDTQARKGWLAVAVALATVPLEYNPLLWTDEQKSEKILLGPLKIPRAIVSNLALSGYSTLDDLAYFGHKEFEDLCSSKIKQALNRGGAKYSNKVIKRL